jgi:hypothetical protein
MLKEQVPMDVPDLPAIFIEACEKRYGDLAAGALKQAVRLANIPQNCFEQLQKFSPESATLSVLSMMDQMQAMAADQLRKMCDFAEERLSSVDGRIKAHYRVESGNLAEQLVDVNSDFIERLCFALTCTSEP